MDLPRYSCRVLPPYAYVPGQTPHPVSDPRGHMQGVAHAAPPPLAPNAWQQSEAYLYGIDLFNHGFYWEAHEAWESLWLAAGRTGLTALWLKALIKYAAAMVKVRAGNPIGALRHIVRAEGLLAELDAATNEAEVYCGMRRETLNSLHVEMWGVADRSPATFDREAILPVGMRLDYPS